jgi:hypothetical protein
MSFGPRPGKVPEYPKIFELAVSEMRQDGQDMREHIVMVHVDQIYLRMDTLNRSSSSRRREMRRDTVEVYPGGTTVGLIFCGTGLAFTQ